MATAKTEKKTAEKKAATKKTTTKKSTPKAEKVEKVEKVEKIEEVKEPKEEVKIEEVKPVEEVKIEPKAEPKEEQMFTKADLERAIAEAVARATANNGTTVVQVEQKSEMVTLMFIGGIASGTTVFLGDKIGRIFRDGDSIDVEKKVFLSNINPVVDLLLRNRKLMVMNGLTEEERIRYGVNYKPDELLDNKMFQQLLDYPVAELVEIYKKLCKEHKEILTKMLYTGSLNGDKRATAEKLKAIIKVDKELGIEGSPLMDEIKRRAVEL